MIDGYIPYFKNWNIKVLGEKSDNLLYSKGLIEHIEDIYKSKKEGLLELLRFAEKSAQNPIDATERSEQTALSDKFQQF